MYFAERKYLEEATRIGPAPDETLPPLILAFDPPRPSHTGRGRGRTADMDSPAAVGVSAE